MFVILHGGNVFCGYSPLAFLIWEKFSFEHSVIRPNIFHSEVEAVTEGNLIQKQYHVAVSVVPIEQWISENKK